MGTDYVVAFVSADVTAQMAGLIFGELNWYFVVLDAFTWSTGGIEGEG